MRLYAFILTFLLSLVGNPSLTLANDSMDEMKVDFSDEKIKEGMAQLIHAMNHNFAKPEEIHKLFNNVILLQKDYIIGIIGLEEIFFHLQKTKNINQENYPASLVQSIKKRVKAVYRHHQHSLSKTLTINPEDLAHEGVESAWLGLAMGDKLICGNFLAVTKVLNLHKSKTTFQEDFEAKFANHATLYAISPRLKAYIKNTSKFIEHLRHQPNLAKKYQFAKLAKLLGEGNITNTINAAMRNIYNGDYYVSLHLLEVFAGLNLDGAFEKLKAILNKHKSIPNYDKTAADIKMFLNLYSSLYGTKPPKKPQPLHAKKPSHEKPHKPKVHKKLNEPKPVEVQPIIKEEPKALPPAPVEKRPPEKPGYTLGKYVDGKWWYFRRNMPVMKAPQ